MIKDMVEKVQNTLNLLKQFEDKTVVLPKANTFFETLNGSIVFCYLVDSDDEGKCIVLKGGHGNTSASGEKPGETYWTDDKGFYKSSNPADTFVMALSKELDITLP